MRLLTRSVAVSTGLLAGAVASAAVGGWTVDVPDALAGRLPAVRRTTTVPVILPPRLTLAGRPLRTYVGGNGTRNAWTFTIADAPRCDGADACFVAEFDGTRGGRLPGRANTRLASGDPALYRAISCGGSCAPASIWFVHRGVLYAWQIKDPLHDTRVALTALANAAVRAGPR